MAEASKKQNWFVRTWNKIRKYFRDTKSELKKVSYPSLKQVRNNTIIVLLCVLIVGIFVWIFDAVATLVIQGLISLVKGG